MLAALTSELWARSPQANPVVVGGRTVGLATRLNQDSRRLNFGLVAQSVEQRPFKPLVLGSSPSQPTTLFRRRWTRKISIPRTCSRGRCPVSRRGGKARQRRGLSLARQRGRLRSSQHKAMGRTYWFECGKCGYRAKVAGRPDRGLDFFVQTILCRDCKELYDAVIRVRLGADHKPNSSNLRLMPGRPRTHALRVPKRPPKFDAVLNRLPHSHSNGFKWVSFQPQCPVSSVHRVRAWRDPDRCPRCGLHLDKSALPFRIWD